MAHTTAPSTGHDAHDVRAHVRTYMMVFGTLMVATVVTVAVAQVHLAIPLAVSVALLIAAVKGSLVALFFMHLKGESGQIYRVLLLTGVFLIFLFGLPLVGMFSTTNHGNRLWTVQPHAAEAPAAHH